MSWGGSNNILCNSLTPFKISLTLDFIEDSSSSREILVGQYCSALVIFERDMTTRAKLEERFSTSFISQSVNLLPLLLIFRKDFSAFSKSPFTHCKGKPIKPVITPL